MKKSISLLLALVMLLSLAACSIEPAKSTAGESHTDSAFTDDCGREVLLPEHISRIVPSGPLAQIVLYALAPEMLVGLASEWNNAEDLIPADFLDLPYFGKLYDSADLNVEALALAAPQIIVDIGEEKPASTKDMDTLQAQTSIPTVFISATLETMPETFRKLGKLLHREEKAEKLAQFCERVYSRTISIMDEVGENKVTALYVLGSEGLNVLARDSYHSELLDLLTNNLAVVDQPVSKGTGNEVTMEQLALWNPDFLLFASDSIYDTVAETDTWAEMTAIKNGRYLEVPEGPHNWMGNPPGVQRYLGMIWLTAALYPEYCDYDAEAEIYEYYELFYGCRLTTAQYDTLTANAFWG